MTLLVAPCSRDAALHATRWWHYSRSMPLGRVICYGAWWQGEFRGAVVYARGNNRHLGKPYGLSDSRHVVELCRIALDDHPEFPVTQVVARTLSQLQHTNSGLRLALSFADPEHGHDGAIYRAGNWIYLGRTEPVRYFLHRGRWVHQRDVTGAPQFHSRASGIHHPNVGGNQSHIDIAALPFREASPKHRYGYPFDRAMRRQLTHLSVPFPGQRLKIAE